MARVLITGATGWVGSILAAELEARGHELVFLVRGDRGRRRLLERVGDASPTRRAVVDGDIALPDAGLDGDTLARWRGRVDLVVHSAAIVRLDDAGEGELRRVNVEGTRHVLALAESIGAPAFCFVSTCAVAGGAARFSEDDVDVGQPLRNAYERSKLEAEKLVRRWSGRMLILRLPGLVGDSRTGTTVSFSGAFYRVTAAYWMMRSELWREWSGRGRADLQAEGIQFDEEGTLHLPLHVPFSPEGNCEIMPQDWIAATMAEVIGGADAQGTFHLVHPSPPATGWAMEASLAHLGIAPPEKERGYDLPRGPWLRLVRRSLTRIAGPHYPYLLHMPRLGRTNLTRHLGDRGVEPPPIDEALLGRVLEYACRKEFSE